VVTKAIVLVLGVVIVLASSSGEAGAVESVKDTPFVQEYHEAYPLEPGGEGDDVRAVVVDKAGTVWAATRGGVFSLRNGKWTRQAGVTEGQTFDLCATDTGVWVAAWDGAYLISDGTATKVDAFSAPIATVGEGPDGIVAMGPDGAWQLVKGRWTAMDGPWSRNLRDVVTAPDGTLWIGTGLGAYNMRPEGVRRFFEPDEVFSGEVRSLDFAPDGRLWIGSWGGITVLENGACVAQITGEQGLPNWDVRCVKFAPDGVLWAGTAMGISRYCDSPEWISRNNGSKWSLRHSIRWVLSDDVRDIDFDKDGTAWIATSKGVSAIKRRMMTLEEKAAYYLDICMKRHVREPFFVEKCYFPDPNDMTKWEPRDDDNDGEYTSLFMMTECFRYAATKDPEAKANADKAYEALEFLQKVTETDGFFARTVVPTSWTRMADMNETYSDEERAARRVRDPRWKPVEERWRKSSCGKWWWKGDTSSDEMNGHMMGYHFYYDLVADAERKERVAQHVDNIMSHIIKNDYDLTDPIDGKPTRWGVWNPDTLFNNPDWWVESHINCLEMLTFLRIGYHMTGKESYMKEYDKFLYKYDFLSKMRRPKAHRRSEWNHIDDGMIQELGPSLMLLEDDPELRAIYMEGITWSYRMVENDQNPLFNFAFGLCGGENVHLQESVEFLRDQPLDLRHYTIDNSKRDDIDLVRKPMQTPLQTSRMLPPSERGVMRWDKNPWAYISGDFCDPKGSSESSGVFWLAPYWMGRYLGYIEAP
jgi:hypothetical protein